MRGIGNHTPPAEMQDEPADNTTADVNKQVNLFYLYPDRVIHTETAREIAAWWQASDSRGLAFAEFASTGTISDRLLPAIYKEIDGVGLHPTQVAQLQALGRYVQRATTDGTRFVD